MKLFTISLSTTIFLVAFFMNCEEISSSDFSQKIISIRWNDTIDLDAIEMMLKEESIESIESMKEYAQKNHKIYDSDNSVLLITLKNGIKAVFKPGEESIGEIIAYKASRLFKNYKLVPPTVQRKIGDEYGSLQLFIGSDIDLLKEKKPPFTGEYWDKLNPNDISAMKLFYFIFGQWDINQGNQIITEDNGKFYIALIDNSGIANMQQVQYGDYAYIRCGYSEKRNDSWDEPFPFDNSKQLKDISLEEIQKLFGDFMSKERIERFWNRYKNKQMNYCLWRNALWVQYYKFDTKGSPLFIEEYTNELVEIIKNITKESLEEIWKSAHGVLPKSLIKQHIENTLNRCKQVLAHISQINPALKKQ